MTIFSKIVAGEIPCYKVAEDEKYFAFLDINPMTKGHTLVIPKAENDYVFDLDDETLSGLFIFAKRVALAIEKSIDCRRVGIMTIGLEVPHTHVHLIPFTHESEMNITNKKLQLNKEEMLDIASKIRENFLVH